MNKLSSRQERKNHTCRRRLRRFEKKGSEISRRVAGKGRKKGRTETSPITLFPGKKGCKNAAGYRGKKKRE